MNTPLKKVSAVFYQLPSGKEPVRNWLKSMSDENRKIVGTDIATAEYGWPIGMPICRPMGSGLWEIRSNLADSRIARTLFCIIDGKMVLLHGFIKKSQKTPKSDLDLAKRRKKEIES